MLTCSINFLQAYSCRNVTMQKTSCPVPLQHAWNRKKISFQLLSCAVIPVPYRAGRRTRNVSALAGQTQTLHHAGRQPDTLADISNSMQLIWLWMQSTDVRDLHLEYYGDWLKVPRRSRHFSLLRIIWHAGLRLGVLAHIRLWEMQLNYAPHPLVPWRWCPRVLRRAPGLCCHPSCIKLASSAAHEAVEILETTCATK